ncbi:MAG: hypothetical protein IPJ04_07245 [Candidatus Eisenbacteria bacterium]|nr:hypothetical protein [Candidatus Eisenbacteria bacterium]
MASANAATPRVDRREARQTERIREGVRSGELTRGETRHLVRGQARVHRMEARAKADGVVTPGERRKLAHAQNHQSRRIARLKHNDRTR